MMMWGHEAPLPPISSGRRRRLRLTCMPPCCCLLSCVLLVMTMLQQRQSGSLLYPGPTERAADASAGNATAPVTPLPVAPGPVMPGPAAAANSSTAAGASSPAAVSEAPAANSNCRVRCHHTTVDMGGGRVRPDGCRPCGVVVVVSRSGTRPVSWCAARCCQTSRTPPRRTSSPPSTPRSGGRWCGSYA